MKVFYRITASTTLLMALVAPAQTQTPAQAQKQARTSGESAKASQPVDKKMGNKIVISDAWIKTTIPGATVSAAYMRIQSPTPLKLLKVEGAIAADIQIHDMRMNEGVMEMNALPSIDIAAQQTVELKPGGKHVMLMKVAKPIKNGDKVPLALTFEGTDKKTITLRINAIAKESAGKPSAH